MYIYHKEGRIRIVSDRRLEVSDLEEVLLWSFKGSAAELMRDFQVREGKVVSKRKSISGERLKIAMVGVWDIPCGIATYTSFLVEELKKTPHDVRVFAEHNGTETDDPNVVYCWKRGESLRKLTKEIKAYDPDVIFIQHEYGIFPDARKWTKFISSIHDYNYHVVLHSVYKHQDKTVCEAICKSIIVHTEVAQDVLREKGIQSNIHVIPHGCIEAKHTSRLWNIYRSKQTIVQFGFGFEYKGWDVALEAVRIIKETYPEVFYLMLFSESSFSQDHHEGQYEKLNHLIVEKGLEDNVAIVRGFQTDESLASFLRTARVAVFPYTTNPEHVVYGSSGAVRIAMSHGTPSVVGKVPLFFDLEGVLPRAGNAEELAEEIMKLFRDPKTYNQLVQKSIEFTRTHSWRKTAQRYLKMVR